MMTSIANSSPSRQFKRTNWRILVKARKRNGRAMAQRRRPGDSGKVLVKVPG